MAAVADEAAQGNLEARILHCHEPDALRTVARSINHLLDMTDAFLREAGAVPEHASEGKAVLDNAADRRAAVMLRGE